MINYYEAAVIFIGALQGVWAYLVVTNRDRSMTNRIRIERLEAKNQSKVEGR